MGDLKAALEQSEARRAELEAELKGSTESAARLSEALEAERAAAGKDVGDLKAALEQSEARRMELESELVGPGAVSLDGLQKHCDDAVAGQVESEAQFSRDVLDNSHHNVHQQSFSLGVMDQYPLNQLGTLVPLNFATENIDSFDPISPVFSVSNGDFAENGESDSDSEDMSELMQALQVERARSNYLALAAHQKMQQNSADFNTSVYSPSKDDSVALESGGNDTNNELPTCQRKVDSISAPNDIYTYANDQATASYCLHDAPCMNILAAVVEELALVRISVEEIFDFLASEENIGNMRAFPSIFENANASSQVRSGEGIQQDSTVKSEVVSLLKQLAESEAKNAELHTQLKITSEKLANEELAVASLREELVSFMIEIQAPTDTAPSAQRSSLQRRTTLALQQMQTLQKEGVQFMSQTRDEGALRRLAMLEEDNCKLHSERSALLAQLAALQLTQEATFQSQREETSRTQSQGLTCAEVGTQTTIQWDDDSCSEHSSRTPQHRKGGLWMSA